VTWPSGQGTLIVLGSEQDESCRFSVGPQTKSVEIQKPCMTTRWEEGYQVNSVTLKVASAALIGLQQSQPIVCTCKRNVHMKVRSSVDTNIGSTNYTEKGEFDRTFHFYAVTPAGKVAVKNGSSIPTEVDRYIFEVSVKQDVSVMFQTCIVSPTSDEKHELAIPLTSEFCPGAGWDQHYGVNSGRNTTQLSTRPFTYGVQCVPYFLFSCGL
jgi:hypothetical protein